MNLYTMNDTFQKATVIDVFDSLVWTERYADSGDFTLVLPSSADQTALLSEGVFLGLDGSREVMIVDTVSDEKGETTFTGRSLVDFLKHRIFRDTWQTTKDSVSYTGAAGAIIQTIVNIAINPASAVATGSVLPGGASAGALESFTYTNTVAATGTSITVAVPYGQLFDAIKMVADLDDLGFSFYPDINGQLQFISYRGLDRTTSQSANAQVIFDSAMDSLSDVSTLRSMSGFRNVAYAWANGMTAQSSIGVAYAPGASTLTKFQRRTLMVDASDVNAADYTAANLTAVLNQKAKDALANNNYVRTVDGQLVPQSTYTYGTDYTLGDVIELRGSSSVSQKARISEYVRAQDTTGERSYPTLSVIG